MVQTIWRTFQFVFNSKAPATNRMVQQDNEIGMLQQEDVYPQQKRRPLGRLFCCLIAARTDATKRSCKNHHSRLP